MRLAGVCKRMIATDTGALILSALFLVALHSATNNQYGFHRDELATIDDARFLDWGYVVYPPVTPFIARVALTLFGPSMIGLRFFGALAAGIAMVLTGLMAREIGGKRPAQLVAAWAGGDRRTRGVFGERLPICLLRLTVVGAGRLDYHPFAEIRKSALVAGVGGCRWPRHDDQVHDGVLSGRHCRWHRADETSLAAQQMAVVRCCRCHPHLPSQSHLAGPARFHHAGFFEVYSCARCRAGQHEWLPARAVLVDNESCHRAALDRRVVFPVLKTGGKALPHDRLDVLDPPGALSDRQRQALLPLAGVPDAARCGRRLGRAMVGSPVPGHRPKGTRGGSHQPGDWRDCGRSPDSASGAAGLKLVEDR